MRKERGIRSSILPPILCRHNNGSSRRLLGRRSRRPSRQPYRLSRSSPSKTFRLRPIAKRSSGCSSLHYFSSPQPSHSGFFKANSQRRERSESVHDERSSVAGASSSSADLDLEIRAAMLSDCLGVFSTARLGLGRFSHAQGRSHNEPEASTTDCLPSLTLLADCALCSLLGQLRQYSSRSRSPTGLARCLASQCRFAR